MLEAYKPLTEEITERLGFYFTFSISFYFPKANLRASNARDLTSLRGNFESIFESISYLVTTSFESKTRQYYLIFFLLGL